MMVRASVAADAPQQWQERARASLQGLPGVYVLVEPLNREAERDGLTKAQVQTDVELHLRKAGIQVLTKEEWSATPGFPYLYVNLNLWKSPYLFVYIYHLTVQFLQNAMLERDLSSWSTVTWEQRRLGHVGSASLRSLREPLGDMVDAFLNDFLAANPSLAPAPTPRSRPPVAFSPSLVSQVQERLTEAGFGPGMPDGRLGPQTQHALRQFQRASNLPVTGTLDQATLEALGIQEGSGFPPSTPRTRSNSRY
jgi:hypothetical protein